MPSALELVEAVLSNCIDSGIAPGVLRLHPTTYAEYVASVPGGPPTFARNRTINRMRQGRAELVLTVEIVADDSVPEGSFAFDCR
jgi:hypothetical protein